LVCKTALQQAREQRDHQTNLHSQLLLKASAAATEHADTLDQLKNELAATRAKLDALDFEHASLKRKYDQACSEASAALEARLHTLSAISQDESTAKAEASAALHRESQVRAELNVLIAREAQLKADIVRLEQQNRAEATQLKFEIAKLEGALLKEKEKEGDAPTREDLSALKDELTKVIGERDNLKYQMDHKTAQEKVSAESLTVVAKALSAGTPMGSLDGSSSSGSGSLRMETTKVVKAAQQNSAADLFAPPPSADMASSTAEEFMQVRGDRSNKKSNKSEAVATTNAGAVAEDDAAKLLQQVEDLTQQLAVAKKNAKTSNATAQSLAKSAAQELKTVKMELEDLKIRYEESLKHNDDLLQAQQAAEEEYNAAASHLIATVEVHRINQQTRIEYLQKKVQQAEGKLKDAKAKAAKAKADRLLLIKEIKSLRSGLVAATGGEWRESALKGEGGETENNLDGDSDNESAFSIVSEIHRF